MLRDLVVDLVAWGETVARSAARTDREAMLRDEQAELDLSRAVDVVGEIAGRSLAASPEWPSLEAEEELQNACRMRNRHAHGYDDVVPQGLFDIARNDVARLTIMARA